MEIQNIQLDAKIQLRFDDYQKVTGFVREDFIDCNSNTKGSSDDGYDSEDLISVCSMEDDLTPEFEEMRHMHEIMIKGKTKAYPMVGEYEEENSHIIAPKHKQGLEFEENFDDMVVDEGVSASNLRI